MNFVLLSACRVCVPGKKGLTCCGKGGSWRGLCGQEDDPAYEHTFEEGYLACASGNIPGVAFEFCMRCLFWGTICAAIGTRLFYLAR